MRSVIWSTWGDVKRSRNLFHIMLPVFILLLMVQANASGSPGGWADHPALESFDLCLDKLPSELYLVRTRGSLPFTSGVVVHGNVDGLYLVSGDEAVVMGLVEQGCGVFPLEKPDSIDPSLSLPVRTWSPVTIPDEYVEEMVAQVNWAGISSKIQWLVDFGTRYSFASNHTEVVEALVDQFTSIGLTPELHSYDLYGTTLWNVVATQTGTVYPDSFIVVCGHFDSVSGDPYVSAPGADDNGTGTTTVLTAAEILTQYDFQYSIRYICFSGEEQGLKGSQAYAGWAAANNIGIVGVLNFDMLGYWEPGVEMDLEIETNEDSEWFALAILNAADLYTDTPYELHVYNGAWWGDHASFWAEGFTAVNHEEAWDWGDPDFNPYYHTTNDLLMYIGEDFMVGNVQLCVAALATIAVHDSLGTGVNSGSVEPIPSLILNAQPNPFTEQIEFTVTGLEIQDSARIHIYDVLGRQVDAFDLNLTGGQGTVLWIPGSQVGTGVYFARIENTSSANVLRLLYLE